MKFGHRFPLEYRSETMLGAVSIWMVVPCFCHMHGVDLPDT